MKYLILSLLLLVTSCRPARWNSATIQEINATGQVSKEYSNVYIEWCNDHWVRFRTPEGKISLQNMNLRIIYH